MNTLIYAIQAHNNARAFAANQQIMTNIIAYKMQKHITNRQPREISRAFFERAIEALCRQNCPHWLHAPGFIWYGHCFDVAKAMAETDLRRRYLVDIASLRGQFRRMQDSSIQA